MTWTYDPASVTTTLAKVRLLCGDTQSGRQLLSDEEINVLTGLAAHIFGMAAVGCETIASKFAADADKEVGDLSITLSQKAEAYERRADRFRQQAGTLAIPLAGGISIAAKDTQEQDTDRVKPQVSRGQFVNPGGTEDNRFADYSGKD